jgi:hypothetical protein
MLRHVAVFSMLCLAFAGCRPAGPEWVIGSGGAVSKADAYEVEAARGVAANYVSAWIDKDYRTMFDLHSRRAMFADKYTTFLKLASTWRTKGFPQRSVLVSVDRDRITATMAPLHMTDEQAQILLVLTGGDKKKLNEIRSKQWPDRVLFMKLVIGSNKSVLILVEENETWRVLIDPGQLTPDMLSPDLREQLLR